MLSLGGAVSLYMYFTTDQRRSELLIDLGLSARWASETPTPFFNWGWRKSESERVWGERIVKRAFKRANLWLAEEDLQFFERTCKKRENGASIDECGVLKQIDLILYRNSILNQSLQERVKDLLHRIHYASDKEAEESLFRTLGHVPSKSDAKRDFALLELRNELQNMGAEALAANQNGLVLTDPKNAKTFHLRGLDGWTQCVYWFKEALMYQLTHRLIGLPVDLRKSLQERVQKQIFDAFERDIQQAVLFRDSLGNLIERKEISIDRKTLENVEEAFYAWQFSNSVNFRSIDHYNIRKLLMNEKLDIRFREIIFKKITLNFKSYQTLLDWFPRRILFYGRGEIQRKFACEQYHRHLEALSVLFKNQSKTTPLSLFREALTKRMIEEVRLTSEEEIEERNYLTDLIETNQNCTCQEHEIRIEEKHRHSWIISLALEDFSVNEYYQLMTTPFKSYVKICCDRFGRIDPVGKSFQAQKKRADFFHNLLNTLIIAPTIEREMSEPAPPTASSNESDSEMENA